MNGGDKHTKRGDRLLLACVIVTSAIYIGWRVIFTLPLSRGVLSAVFGAALCAAEMTGVLEAFAHYRNAHTATPPEKPDIPGEMYPHVDILITTHNEEPELLYKTLSACGFLKYPDRGKVHVYLCDDTARPEMGELAERLGAKWLALSGNKDAKAGNLNNALQQTNSPLVVTLDADMIPTSDFLLETVPYFFLPKMIKEDGVWRLRNEEEIDGSYKIGFVQTPQSFYNPDMFQFNLYAQKHVPNEQDYFFREVNAGRNRTNSAVYAGSNTVLSREALEAAGGIRTGTVTEDFATGIDIQAAGYAAFAINKVLAHGFAPSDIKSLLKQRQRWGRGCVQVLRGGKFLFGKLNLRAKLSYCVCGMYWWTFFRRLIYIISPIVFVFSGIVIVECSLFELLLIWLPAYLFYGYAQKKFSGNIRSARWSNIIDTILFPYLIIPIILETLGIRMKKFFVTSKAQSSSRNSSIIYAVPHMILAPFSAVALAYCIYDFIVNGSYGAIIIIYWLCVNLYTLLNAVAFYAGRTNYRSCERFPICVPVKLKARAEISGVTADLSEHGMAVLLAAPECGLQDTCFRVELEYKDYCAEVWAKALYMARLKNGDWQYGLEIAGCSKRNRRQYLQILFDRDHTLPTRITSTLPQDIWAVLKGILKRHFTSSLSQTFSISETSLNCVRARSRF